jgi:hypothetical protein
MYSLEHGCASDYQKTINKKLTPVFSVSFPPLLFPQIGTEIIQYLAGNPALCGVDLPYS